MYYDYNWIANFSETLCAGLLIAVMYVLIAICLRGLTEFRKRLKVKKNLKKKKIEG